MRNALAGLVMACGLLPGVAAAQDNNAPAEEVIGEQVRVNIRPDQAPRTDHLKLKPRDVAQFHITDPAMGRKILKLQVHVKGAARKAAVARTGLVQGGGKSEPGTEGVNVFVVAEKEGSATVHIVFYDNEGKPITRDFHLDIVGK